MAQPRKTRPDITEIIVDWDIKNQIKQKKPTDVLMSTSHEPRKGRHQDLSILLDS